MLEQHLEERKALYESLFFMAFTVRHGPKLYYAGQLKAGKKTQSLMV
jgi:hypothetical protein